MDAWIFLLIILFIIFLPFCELIGYNHHPIFVNSIFIILLLLSLYKNKFALTKYFLDKKDLFFWLYLFLISLNIWFAPDKNAASHFYKFLCLTAILIYFPIKNEITWANLQKIFYIHCICAALVSIFGLWEILSKTNFIYEHFVSNYYYSRFIAYKRMMSTFIHPNILGAYLITAIPTAYYFYKSKNFVKFKVLNLIIFVIISCALFLTFSRGTWIAFLFTISVWLFLKKKAKWIIFVWMGFFIFLFIADLPFISGNIRVRFGISHFLSYLCYGHRAIAYFITANMIKYHPLVGIGLNHYRMLFGQYSNIRLPCEVMIPDSIYLMHLAETGLLGFLALALFLGGIIKRPLRALKNLEKEKKKFYFALIVTFAALLFNMASFDGFLWRSSFYLFWLLAAINAGITSLF